MAARRLMRAMIALFLFSPLSTRADPTTQASSQKEADLLYRQSSDASLQTAVVNAMKAMTQLSQGSVSGAFHTGATAYGEWDNSNNLDRASREAFAARQGLGDNTGTPPPSQTSFARLDPAFLHKGDAALAGAEFEKATGMKRELFLKRLSDASSNPIQLSDPQVISKYLDRIENLTKDMSNGTAKFMVHKTLRAIPVAWLDLSSSAIKGAIAAAAKVMPASPAPVAAPTVVPVLKEVGEATPPPAAESAVAAAAPVFERKPAEASAGVVNGTFMKDILFADPRAGEEEESIFLRVHRRYQLVAERFR